MTKIMARLTTKRGAKRGINRRIGAWVLVGAMLAAGFAIGAVPVLAGEAGIRSAALSVPEADLQRRAASTMERLGQDAVAILSNRSLDKEQRIAYFRRLLARDLDIPVLAKFMLGRHWKTVTDSQREAYKEIFAEFLLDTYSSRLGGTKVDAFIVMKVGPAGATKDIFVYSLVRRSNASPIQAVWRMRSYGDTFRVVDLVIEGISMAITLRQEFSAILRRDGVDGLIQKLQSRSG